MAGVLLGPRGGSRAWRRLVAAVLARDGYTCRMRRDGAMCGAPATTCNHIVQRAYGGGDTMDNLEAACVPCNMGAGARISGAAGAWTVTKHNQVVALVRVLDRYNVPVEMTVGRVMGSLPDYAPHPWHRSVVIAAVMYRRARGPLTRV
jgi:hypothetical protein